MNWYENLYLGKTVKGKERRIRWKVEHGKYQYGIYLIVLSTHPDALLRILPASVLLQPAYPKEQLQVVGIAGSSHEAKELIQDMLTQIYEDTGGFDFAAYMS